MGDQIVIVDGSRITARELAQAIRQRAQKNRITNDAVNYNGAEQTALNLIQMIRAHREHCRE